MRRFVKVGVLLITVLIPLISLAQSSPSGDVSGLNSVLDKLFNEMIPQAQKLIDVSQAIAGFGALWYIAFRVWKHLARAEPIDFYPLLRPFAIGLAIFFFIPLVNMMNSILAPLTKATKDMGGDARYAIVMHLDQEQDSVDAAPPAGLYPYTGTDAANMDKYEQPDNTSDNKGFFSGLKSAFSFLNIKNIFKTFCTFLVGLIYEAISLCINTIRTFYLVILVILGPIVLGLSVFDGFHQSLVHWFSRYINIYMWLPVCNVFGGISSTILKNMFELDQNFFSSTAYIIFMIICIVGYTTVPNVANYIVQVGGKDTLLHKVNQMSRQAGKAAVAML